ncbi:hypothetical protein KKA69_04385, partial [Patescibacteria group bacterium]|nr:hypothetical protein [Patescibacteria group bacterium]
KLAGAIGKSWTGIYDIYNALGDTLEGQYSITEDFVVSDTLDSRWNIRQNVSDTLRFKYIIKTYIPSVVWDGDLEVDVSLNVDATVNSDGTVDLVAKQGSTWLLTLTIKQSTGAAMDLTDYTARGMIRKKYKSEDPIEEFHCTVLTPKADGQIEVTLSATETALVPAKTYVYDIEIENNTGYVTRVMQGKLKVDPEVTK